MCPQHFNQVALTSGLFLFSSILGSLILNFRCFFACFTIELYENGGRSSNSFSVSFSWRQNWNFSSFSAPIRESLFLSEQTRLLPFDGHFHFAERLSPLLVIFFFKYTSLPAEKEVIVGRLSYICHYIIT